MSRIRSKCTPQYSAKLYSRDNVAHIIAHLVHPLHPLVHGVFLNTISQYFTGIIHVPRNGLYHALGAALKASQRWETHKLCRGGCESLSSLLSLLILASSLPRLHSGYVRLTNEGNKLCRRPATSCIMKRDLFRARARPRTRNYKEVRFHFPRSCQNHVAQSTIEENSMLIAELLWYQDCAFYPKESPPKDKKKIGRRSWFVTSR